MKLFEVALQQPIKNRLLVIGKASDIVSLKKRMIFLTGRFEVVIEAKGGVDQKTIDEEKQQMFSMMQQFYPKTKKSATKYLYAWVYSHTSEYKTLFQFADAFEKLVNTFQNPNGEWAYILAIFGLPDTQEQDNE